MGLSDFKNIPIGEVLKEYGYITDVQLQQALAHQKEHKGKRLGSILVAQGFISEVQMLGALGKRLNLERIDLTGITVDVEAVKEIPYPLVEKHDIFCIAASEHQLTVVTNDPLNFYGLEDIRQTTGKELQIMLCEKAQIEIAIQYYYSEIAVNNAAYKVNSSMTEVVEEIKIEEGDDDTPIIKLLNSLVHRAYNTTASDIHIEPFEDKTLVRMRVDGAIIDYVTLQRFVHNSLIVRIKILSELDIAERRIPQDGHFRIKIEGQDVNIRVSVIPTVFGEKAVLRLLAGNAVIDHADSYGMIEADFDKITKMLRIPHGIIYMTGPTGSGKTTTLYMILEELSRRHVNISTIEDPVEKNLSNINQMQVNNMAGLTFEVGLRALMRQDPDIIMVGETRDAQTASISIRAAITGHQVLSTLHTNNAAASVVRLVDMGMEPYMIASTLVGVVAQRLMRKVCPHCGRQEVPTAEERVILGDEITTVSHPAGCIRCNNTGYRGRVAIHEILLIDSTVKEMITTNISGERIAVYAKEVQGMVSLKERALELVTQGVTTVEELLKVAYYS